LTQPAGAVEIGGVGFTGGGFLTVAAGRIVGGDAARDFNGYRSPMFVTDYAQGGIYEDRGWTLRPDSKLGLQGTATLAPTFSLTGQVVARGSREHGLGLEWAYGSYALGDRATMQFGRKRLPLFYYSETQDVGVTYPWVHLPSGQYGWEIVNYNGANLLYRDQFADWSASFNVFAGGETRRDIPYWKIYNGRQTRTDSKWSQIVGGDMTWSKEWFDVRVAYIQSYLQNRFEDPAAAPPYGYSPRARQRIYALSFNVEKARWVLHNEYLYMDRREAAEEDYSFLLGVGHRIDRFLPMLTYNRYWFRSVDPAVLDPAANEGWSTLALSLRYDLTPSSALKVQVERWKDLGGPNFNGGVPYGNARLLSASYDLSF
jgi:hypothetical protein